MGFKADLSFLSKLTMGATATRAAMKFLQDVGFSPVELERYCTSNKIWTTKVKRLRLPDLLCIRTGVRIEIRGKSKLEIKMSDSPKNPDRRWDSGARDEDLVALVACRSDGVNVQVRGTPTFMTVGAMRASVATSKLGPPKAASEGAEQDRRWPSTVPKEDGEVISVEANRIKTKRRSGRNQTYNTRGMTAYVAAGDTFVGSASIIAGTLPRLARITDYLGVGWNPGEALGSQTAADRYAAAKALAYRTDVQDARQLLEAALATEEEHRTALEIAGAAARRGSQVGLDRLRAAVFTPAEGSPDFLPMEAIFILSELPAATSAGILENIASAHAFVGNEVRQAAAWGLGKQGCRAYDRLLQFLEDTENDFVMHVIAAFGSDTPIAVIQALVEALATAQDDRTRSTTSAALVQVGSRAVAEALLAAANAPINPWFLATLGQLPASSLGGIAVPRTVELAMAPVRVLSADRNWLAAPLTDTNFQFLMQQNL